MLVLGSLPGQVSLQHRQYYAQPRNAFWPVMSALFGFELDLAYPLRLAALVQHKVALWDVCASASRPGSLDAAIVQASVVPNDFAGFFASHEHVTAVFFNGAKAASLYRRLVLPTLPANRPIMYEVLPSTSPAHAALPLAAKRARWSGVRRASEP